MKKVMADSSKQHPQATRPERRAMKILCVVLALTGPALGLESQDRDRARSPRLSPFSGIRWKEVTTEVQVKGRWYELISINDLAATKIVEHCRKVHKDLWQKRFGEDLIQVLREMGTEPGTTARLELRDLETGKAVKIEAEPMTKENRQAIWEANVRQADAPARNAARATMIMAAREAEEDLDQLAWQLEHRFSYLRRRGVDYRAALDSIHGKLGEGITRDAFAIQIAKLLALFGDGHSRLANLSSYLPPGAAPFLFGDENGHVVAFQGNRSGFVDTEHPYLRSLDGVPIAKWIEAAARLSPAGSPAFLRRQAIRALQQIGHLRKELGLKTEGKLRVELESKDGKRVRAIEIEVRDRGEVYGDWPRRNTQLLEGSIGYLRLASMEDDPEFLASLKKRLTSFRETKGLIIDVRGNGGGARAALELLFPYFMAAGESPVVANVAAYRLDEGEDPNAPEGYLEDRHLFPAASSRWTDEDRAAIRQVSSRFEPEWMPPKGEFSAWHYFVLRRAGDADLYHYDRPVVVLMNEDCFSATDIFLGALKGRKGVTLLGAASGGGSGRAQPVRLSHSGIELRLSSMASFRPDGRLYEGRGVEPDIEVKPVATDFIGQSDTAIEAALKRLRP